MAGGHRRYAETEVAAVLEVVRHRDAGLALETAVRRVTTESPRPRSIYAELRRVHPTLPTQVLSKASLVALSHAIEDECCARAQEPLLFGCFQRDTFLRSSRRAVGGARPHRPGGRRVRRGSDHGTVGTRGADRGRPAPRARR